MSSRYMVLPVTVMQFGLLYVLSLSGQKKRRKMRLNRVQPDPFSLPSVQREKRFGDSGLRKIYVCSTLNLYFEAFQFLLSSATGIDLVVREYGPAMLSHVGGSTGKQEASHTSPTSKSAMAKGF
ncbi:MAG: hypothetical protein ACXVDN_14655 [Ktedonobacteraceae bacterium]